MVASKGGRANVKCCIWFILGTALSLVTSVGSVQAHGFNLGFLAPLSGPDSRLGRETVKGFLLATRERDGHAFEESDGHLGGLDSYVITIDTGRSIEFVRGELDSLLTGEGTVFLTGVAVPETIASTGVKIDEAQTALVDPMNTQIFHLAVSTPESLVTMGGVPYSTAYQKAYGHEPGPYAIRGYIAARLIDAAVSAIEGRFSQRDALRRALDRARQDLQGTSNRSPG